MMDNYSGLRTNLTMLMDFYEITMANGYFTNGYRDRIAYFDMFFRHVPNDGGFFTEMQMVKIFYQVYNN